MKLILVDPSVDKHTKLRIDGKGGDVLLSHSITKRNSKNSQLHMRSSNSFKQYKPKEESSFRYSWRSNVIPYEQQQSTIKIQKKDFVIRKDPMLTNQQTIEAQHDLTQSKKVVSVVSGSRNENGSYKGKMINNLQSISHVIFVRAHVPSKLPSNVLTSDTTSATDNTMAISNRSMPYESNINENGSILFDLAAKTSMKEKQISEQELQQQRLQLQFQNSIKHNSPYVTNTFRINKKNSRKK